MPFYQEEKRLIKIIHFPLNNDKLIAGPKNVLRNSAAAVEKGKKTCKKVFLLNYVKLSYYVKLQTFYGEQQRGIWMGGFSLGFYGGFDSIYWGIM